MRREKLIEMNHSRGVVARQAAVSPGLRLDM